MQGRRKTMEWWWWWCILVFTSVYPRGCNTVHTLDTLPGNAKTPPDAPLFLGFKDGHDVVVVETKGDRRHREEASTSTPRRLPTDLETVSHPDTGAFESSASSTCQHPTRTLLPLLLDLPTIRLPDPQPRVEIWCNHDGLSLQQRNPP